MSNVVDGLIESMHGVSDLELSRKTGVSRTMIFYFRTKRRKSFTHDVVLKIADALGYDVVLTRKISSK